MDKNLIANIKKLIERKVVESDSEDEYLAKQSSKLQRIISDYLSYDETNGQTEKIDAINEFINENEVQKRKINAYCQDFLDPTERTTTNKSNVLKLQRKRRLGASRKASNTRSDSTVRPITNNNNLLKSLEERSVIVVRQAHHLETTPTRKPKTIMQNGEEIRYDAYFQDDDLVDKVYRFVQKHKFDKPFYKTVYEVMNNHDMTAPQVYNLALLRRQDFHRAVDSRTQTVQKRLVWQIIVGLRCNLQEADDILFSAGYMRRNNKFDLTMEYFIERKIYDVMAINEVLYAFDCPVFPCYKSVKDKDNQ